MVKTRSHTSPYTHPHAVRNFRLLRGKTLAEGEASPLLTTSENCTTVGGTRGSDNNDSFIEGVQGDSCIEGLPPLSLRGFMLLAEGAFGEVYSCFDLRLGCEVALKVSKTSHSTSKDNSTHFFREIALLRLLPPHPNIIRVLGRVGLFNDQLAFAMPKMEGTLRNLLQRERLSRGEVRSLIRDIVGGVAHLHEHQIMHRDLKPQNILVDATGRCLVCDFGCAIRCAEGRSNTLEVGTIWYKAPEILLQDASYALPADIWSLGCIYYQVHARAPLFPGADDDDVLDHISSRLGKVSLETWPSIISL